MKAMNTLFTDSTWMICLSSYLALVVIAAILLWPALVLAKRDDQSRGLD
jgi:hypothetical protein